MKQPNQTQELGTNVVDATTEQRKKEEQRSDEQLTAASVVNAVGDRDTNTP